jgi:hypothetical protein
LIVKMAGLSDKPRVMGNQLHRTLGVTLKTAWFMSHRIRVAKGLDDAARADMALQSIVGKRLTYAQ